MTLLKTLLSSPRANILAAMDNIANRDFRFDKIDMLGITAHAHFLALENAEGKVFAFSTKLTAELLLELLGPGWPGIISTLTATLSKDGTLAYSQAFTAVEGRSAAKGQLARSILEAPEHTEHGFLLAQFTARAFEKLQHLRPDAKTIDELMSGMMATLSVIELAERDELMDLRLVKKNLTNQQQG
jgi:hypothetical protein